jgi:hypothetical protein
MLPANTAPGVDGGRQAMWLDGQLVGEFTGIRRHRDFNLKANCHWLDHYGYDVGDPKNALGMNTNPSGSTMSSSLGARLAR